MELSCFPQCAECSLRFHPKEDNALILELLFSYNCTKDCPDCTIHKKIKRTMSIETAIRQIDSAMELAKREKKDALYVHFMGGNSFDRLDDIVKISKYVKKKQGYPKVCLFLYTSLSSNTNIYQQLNRIHCDYKLVIKCAAHSQLRSCPIQDSLCSHCVLQYRITRECVGSGLIEQGIMKLSNWNMPIYLAYDDVEKWSDKDIAVYVQLVQHLIHVSKTTNQNNSPFWQAIKQAFLTLSFSQRNCQNVVAIDTTEAIYGCHLNSPLEKNAGCFLYQNEMQRTTQAYRYAQEKCDSCDLFEDCAPCTADLYIFSLSNCKNNTSSTNNCYIRQVNSILASALRFSEQVF